MLNQPSNLLLLVLMIQTILPRSDANALEKIGIKTLTGAEASHHADVLHTHLGISLVGKKRHGIVHAIVVHKLRVVLVETSCTYSGDITRVGI